MCWTKRGDVTSIFTYSRPGSKTRPKGGGTIPSKRHCQPSSSFFFELWSFAPDTGAKAVFRLTAPADGEYEVRLAYREHENRGTQVPVQVVVPVASLGGGQQQHGRRLDMQQPPAQGSFQTLGRYRLMRGAVMEVHVSTEGAGGLACVDACQLKPVAALRD